MQKPEITFHKEILSEDAEHLHCCLCRYGRKKGIILWRVEFRGSFLGFHWLLCNKCRFLIFTAMGGKRLKNLEDMVEKKQISSHLYDLFLSEPKQKISNKGEVKSSYYYSMSPDRRRALDKGMTVKEYENKHAKFIEKKKKKNRKKKKK